jgi:hypothetical protein
MAAVNIVQDDDGYMGLQGTDADAGAFIFAGGEYSATSIDKTTFFIAPRAARVVGCRLRVTVAGSDGGAVTAVIRKVPSGTAIASGTALMSDTFNLKGTADTNQSGTLSTTAGVLDVAAGQALAIDFTGTLTAATGAFTVAMCAM